MQSNAILDLTLLEQTAEPVFDRIVDDLVEHGYSIIQNGLPISLANTLADYVSTISPEQYAAAGVGRLEQHQTNQFVRNDEICWISGQSQAGKEWLEWAAALQQHINRSLFMGLFSFESHFAHYPPGHFYKTHLDAFAGQGNRVLSLVTYLNRYWMPDDGGQLVIYPNENDAEGIRVLPQLGTVVVFLSEQFPHEVLAAQRDRYSIAGWFSVNRSTQHRVDPPR